MTPLSTGYFLFSRTVSALVYSMVTPRFSFTVSTIVIECVLSCSCDTECLNAEPSALLSNQSPPTPVASTAALGRQPSRSVRTKWDPRERRHPGAGGRQRVLPVADRRPSRPEDQHHPHGLYRLRYVDARPLRHRSSCGRAALGGAETEGRSAQPRRRSDEVL